MNAKNKANNKGGLLRNSGSFSAGVGSPYLSHRGRSENMMKASIQSPRGSSGGS